jgi:hypothetical protein
LVVVIPREVEGLVEYLSSRTGWRLVCARDDEALIWEASGVTVTRTPDDDKEIEGVVIWTIDVEESDQSV